MKYLLATSAFSNPDLLEKCISSWPSIGHRLVFIDKDTGLFAEQLNKYTDISYAASPEHLGVSAAWNTILKIAFEINTDMDAVIVVGSDTEMKEGFLEGFINEFEYNKLEFAVANEFSWNCWCMTKYCYEKVGSFDANMFIYFSDNDYHRRVSLSGVPWKFIGDPTLFSHYGSATIRKSEAYTNANNDTFNMCGMYFQEKWGGPPGNETYKLPFNDENIKLKDWKLNKEKYEFKKELWNKK